MQVSGKFPESFRHGNSENADSENKTLFSVNLYWPCKKATRTSLTPKKTGQVAGTAKNTKITHFNLRDDPECAVQRHLSSSHNAVIQLMSKLLNHCSARHCCSINAARQRFLCHNSWKRCEALFEGRRGVDGKCFHQRPRHRSGTCKHKPMASHSPLAEGGHPAHTLEKRT